MKRSVPVLFAALLSASCASGGSGDSSRTTRDIIGLEEIQSVEVANAFELIQRLRPEMLRPRATLGLGGSQVTPTVYLDGVRAGELDQLASVSKDALREVRYISAADATTRFGTGHTGGAIMILTRRGRFN
jgi:hypothetical protein